MLWIYYMLFGWMWMALFEVMGDDLLWAYFGTFCIVGTSMGMGVAYSMKSRQIGWWAQSKQGEQRDTRGQFCGFQIY